jgi:hypothetical protein
MSVHSAYNVGRVVGRVQDRKVDQALAVPVSLAEKTGGWVFCGAEGWRHAHMRDGNVCLWRAPCKGGAFQWVQVPPGNRSSRKQSEQSWR